MSIGDLGRAPPSKISALIPQKKNTHSDTFTYFKLFVSQQDFLFAVVVLQQRHSDRGHTNKVK